MSGRIRLVASLITTAAALIAMTAPASAFVGDLNLADKNATATFSPTSSLGLKSWSVDLQEHVKQQWFWFGIGSGAEQALNTLPLDSYHLTDANFDGHDDTLNLRYVSTGYAVDLRYALSGSQPGGDVSHMTAQITVTNTGATSLDFRFYQYADFDLSVGADTIRIIDGNTADQTSPVAHVAETIVTGAPSHVQAGLRDDPTSILDSLADGSVTTLTGVTGPRTGDAVWAFEWDTTLDPINGVLVISKNMSVTPEPATLALLAAGLGFVFRKRKA
jgi:hypothetical protein